ncbi:MAG: AAA family ATPase [Bacteroidetes bacterium]|nr:AAA family ATPase [Bacteroidota bacterium]
MIDEYYEWRKELVGKYAHRRKVEWLQVFAKPIDIRKYNAGKNLSQVTMYELSSIKFLDIKELLETDKPELTKEQKHAVPYFLIIDEINRGNISKIFGELITLVEKDKRDKIKVRLPYSQKEFSLPSNLYIIGTMNTADRSIAILDTALRRRFVFKEIEPNADIIKIENQFADPDLDLAVLFEKLNAKIAEKVDRDHRLGHSYFLNVFRISDFKIIWYYQIIPLLMEYFYNAAESISSIITDAFIDKKTSQVKMIESEADFKQALLNIR